MVMVRGQGSKVYDAAGKEYLDYMLGSGPLLLGHGRPEVVEAVQRQVRGGFDVLRPERAGHPAGGGAGRGRALRRGGPLPDDRQRGDLCRLATGAGLHRPGQGAQVRGRLARRPRPRPALRGRRRAASLSRSGARLRRHSDRRLPGRAGGPVQRPGNHDGASSSSITASWRPSSSSRCSVRLEAGAGLPGRPAGDHAKARHRAGVRRDRDRLSAGLGRRPGALRRGARPGLLTAR